MVTSAWGARPFWPRERSVAWKARGFGRADHRRCLFVTALFRALDRHIARAMRRVYAQLGCDGLAPGRWAAAQGAQGGTAAAAAAATAASLAAASAMAVGAPSAGAGAGAGAGAATEDASMAVNISFAVQYWGAGEGWSERLATWVAPMLPQLHLAATAAQLSAEVLVNSDSRHVRAGDAAYLVAALGEADSLLLSPATHELRAYNRLAMGLSRGRFVVFVQDDTRPPPPSAGGLLDVRWLTRSLALFLRWPQVGSISLNAGLFFVSNYSEAQVGVQVMDDLPGAARQPVCEAEADRAPGEAAARMVPGVEAIRCADVGPLLVRRAHFLEVGGFNESGTVRGEPGSVNVDCELQARL